MRAQGTLQPLAVQRVKLETASYGAGRASLIDVADAFAALADATLTTVDREAKVAADGAGLNFTYGRSEEHTSELQSLMRISYAVFCLKKKTRMSNEVT